MPEKPKTEAQLLRRLSNTPLQLEVDLLHPETHNCKTTSKEHLDEFYTSFSKIKSKKYDGLIITGAPVETLDFNEVNYWDELKEIIEWAKHNVTSTLFLCWAAQAALYHDYNIKKHPLDKKQFGIFKHKVNDKNCPLVRGFDDVFWAPHSRHTTIKKEDILKNKDLKLISESDEAGVYIVEAKNQIFVTGHSEYDTHTLLDEYERDKKKGIGIDAPKNYFKGGNTSKTPCVKWRSHSTLLFSNWVNYYLYQQTPFDINKINN
jgi:homoserine O-succinyltransferase